MQGHQEEELTGATLGFACHSGAPTALGVDYVTSAGRPGQWTQACLWMSHLQPLHAKGCCGVQDTRGFWGAGGEGAQTSSFTFPLLAPFQVHCVTSGTLRKPSTTNEVHSNPNLTAGYEDKMCDSCKF